MYPTVNKHYTQDLRDKLQQQDDFLTALVEHIRVGTAAKAACISVAVVNRWRKDDILFRERFEEATQYANERLEDEAIRRAHKGYKVPIYQGGVLVGHEIKYSDALMTLLLKGRMPDRYGKIDRQNSGDGQPSTLLILPSSGRELKELPPDAQRIEIPRPPEGIPISSIIEEHEQAQPADYEQDVMSQRTGNEEEEFD